MNVPVIAITPTLLTPTETATRRNSERPNARCAMPVNARTANSHQSPNATSASATGPVQYDIGVGGADDMTRLYRADERKGRPNGEVPSRRGPTG